MARQIINYELFTHKREELRRIEKRRMRRRRMRLLTAAGIFLFLLFVFHLIQQSRCNFYRYKEEIKTEENADVHYSTFSSGYLKYSSNGIEFQQPFGVAKWNIALSFSKPFVAKSGRYIFLGDKGGNQAILFNVEGQVHDFTFRYPIVQLDVAENGNIEAILQGDGCNYVEVYTSSGEMIAETKVTLEETGYPLTAALSPDGSKLAISYYVVNDLIGRSRVALYDFSMQLQPDTIPLIGGFDYDWTLIPKLRFLSKDRLIAYSDHEVHFYQISGTPREFKSLKFDQGIESVFEDDSSFGLVCENDEVDGGKYMIHLYNKKGNRIMTAPLDMVFDDIFMVGKDIAVTKDNACTILNHNGKILYQGTLEGGRIQNVLPCFGWRTYRVVFANKIVKMSLSFFGQ